MSTVLKALGSMGKSTCRELAARLGKDVRETLLILENEKDAGTVSFVNGYWSVTGDASPAPAKKTAVHKIKEPKRKAAVSKSPVSISIIIGQIMKYGPQTTSELADLNDQNAKGLGSKLRAFEKRGLIVRSGKTWAVPAKPEPETIQQPEPARQDDLIIPNVRFISNEIRRTKAKLEHLYKMRDAARQFSKHTNSMKQITTGGSK